MKKLLILSLLALAISNVSYARGSEPDPVKPPKETQEAK